MTEVGSYEKKIAAKLSELGLTIEFIEALLLKDDDWSFIVKCHALVEAGASQALTKHFGDPKLAEVFSWLDMGNKRFGKAKILGESELINPAYLDFLYSLGEVRNELVHKIENVSFEIDKQSSNAELEKKRKGLLKATARVWNHTPFDKEPDSNPFFTSQIVEMNSRSMIYRAIEWSIACFCLVEMKGEIKALMLKVAEAESENKKLRG